MEVTQKGLSTTFESGMVRWSRVETRDREVRVQLPVVVVIFDLVMVCHSFNELPRKGKFDDDDSS